MSCSISYQYLSKSHKNLSKIRFSVAHPMKYETIWWTCGGMKRPQIFENRYSWKNDTIFNIILVWNIICKIDVNVTLRFLHFSFHTPPPFASFLFSLTRHFSTSYFLPHFLFTRYLPNAIYHPFPFTPNRQGWRKKKKDFVLLHREEEKNFFSLTNIFFLPKTLFSSAAYTFFQFFLSYPVFSAPFVFKQR